MKSRIDLHIHSTYSDGEYNIDELLDILKKKKIKYFSICDHDNIKSYYDIKKRKLKRIKYVSGVEISTYLEYTCFHILGYNYHGDISSLEDLLNKISKNRKIRAKEMIDKIENNHDLKFGENEVEKVLEHPSVGKKHVAKMMMKKNLGTTYLEILKKFMTGLHLPTSYRVSVKEACGAIVASGGIPVLAHPKEYELRYNIKIEDYIEKLIDAGVKGIEVYNSIHTVKDTKRYIKLAKKYKLITTGGSDYHGPLKHKVEIGTLVSNEEKLKRINKISIIDYIK